MDKGELYPAGFYTATEPWVKSSAEAIVPYVLELVGPRSVVDVGCGIGIFLREFKARGITEIRGVDGAHVEPSQLVIAPEEFFAADLQRPLSLGRSFDLVVSVEVGEHIPASCADTFVDSLTSLGPIVLFSAAIPFQHGVDHVNEQWPEYWAEKFAARGYEVIDCLRGALWHDARVREHYRQNLLLFANGPALAAKPALAAERERTRGRPLSIVHPYFFQRDADPNNYVLSQVLRWVPAAAKKALSRRVRQSLGRFGRDR